MKKTVLSLTLIAFLFGCKSANNISSDRQDLKAVSASSSTLDKQFEKIFTQKPEINPEKIRRSPEEYREFLSLMKEEDIEEKDLLFEWTQSYERLSKEYIDRTNCNPSDGLHTKNECIAIFVYTTQYFYMINTVLRYGEKKHLKTIQPITDMVSSALKKLPNYKKVVYRGIRESQTVLKTYTKGSTVTAKAFVSTTKDSESEYLLRGIKMIIKSKTGKDISKLGGHDQEDEVLFDKGTTFHIDNAYNENGQTVIEMTETTN